MTVNFYIGYDKREDIAYQICKSSIVTQSTVNVNVSPLIQEPLRHAGIYIRGPDPKSSTDFTFTRFLVPYLNNYNGWAVFADCDFLFLSDVRKLMEYVDDRYAIMVVKHDYQPTETTKMDGKEQTQYPRKNWSSLILFNCSHESNRALTPDLVNTATGLYLHRFQWLKDEEIGELPYQWNYLEDWYNSKDAKAVHFTAGGPWFRNYTNVQYAREWHYMFEETYNRKFTDTDFCD